jgi:eukaryotic-like serine/threonine-protein kinase
MTDPLTTERNGGARYLGGRYRVGTLLAAGGMGTVWAAEDLVLGRPVAVKLLGESLAGAGWAAERLRREARSAARLVHPNIARVLDLGEQDGRPYLVMELLEGESLAARLARTGPLAPADAVGVAAAVADALEAAHRAGVVHRDVKPGNVFLTAGGEVKVLDFGIASAAGEAALTTGDLFGTAAYLAPERALGHQATPAADVYALGVLLYELLSGRLPFQDESDVALAMAHVNAKPPPLSQAAPWVPPALAAAADRALAKDPADRPLSAATFARLLRSAPTPPRLTRTPPRSTGPLPASAFVTSPLPAGRPATRVRGRARRWAVALLVAAAVLAALPALGGVPLLDSGPRAGPATTVTSDPGPVQPAEATTDPGGAVGDPGSGPGADEVGDDEHDQDGESDGGGSSGSG